jgi:putative tryptophan/tyrosine transport system substrate-binding protein
VERRDDRPTPHAGVARSGRLGSRWAVAAVAGLIALIALVGIGRAAQPPARIPRVTYLDITRQDQPIDELHFFEKQLEELGYVIGESIQVRYVYGEGDPEELERRIWAELDRGVDVLVSFGTTASQLAKQVTNKAHEPGGVLVPVVSSGSDPVGTELVDSLAQPGGNVTGLSSAACELAAKRLELLRDMVPSARRLAVLWNPDNRGDECEWKKTVDAAPGFGFDVISLKVRQEADFAAAFRLARTERAEVLAALSSSVINNNSKLVVECAAALRVPGIYAQRQYIDRGGLAFYGPSFEERYRRAAVFVDKILRGARPADLPIEKAQRFQFGLNMEAARSLDLRISRGLRTQADEVMSKPVASPTCPEPVE